MSSSSKTSLWWATENGYDKVELLLQARGGARLHDLLGIQLYYLACSASIPLYWRALDSITSIWPDGFCAQRYSENTSTAHSLNMELDSCNMGAVLHNTRKQSTRWATQSDKRRLPLYRG